MDEIGWFLFTMIWQKKSSEMIIFVAIFLPVRFLFLLGCFQKKFPGSSFSCSLYPFGYWHTGIPTKKLVQVCHFPTRPGAQFKLTGVIIAEGVVRVGGVVQSGGFPKEHCLFHKTMALGGKIPTLKLGSWQVCCYGFCPEKMVVEFREMGHQKGNRLVSKEHDEATRPIFIGSILHSQWVFVGAKLRFMFQPCCFYETRNPGIKRLSSNFCRHSFISSIGRYTCFTMPNLRLYRLPFAACQKPNFSLIPYLILVSYRTILTFHIKSYQITSKSSRIVISHRIISPPSPTNFLQLSPRFQPTIPE